MNRISLVLLVAFFIETTVNSQDYKFGKVSKSELEEKYYPLDSSANAAYLYRKRRTFYDYSSVKGFRIINQYHHRIKIYSKEGFNEATRKIPYYKPDASNNEKVSSITAVTYNLNKDKIIKSKISKNDIFDEKINKYFSQKKVTLPNIKKGSIIEIEYKLVSPFIRSIDDLKFQHNIPVKKMISLIEIPEFFNFKNRIRGYYFINPENSKGKRVISQTFREGPTKANGGYSSYQNSKANYTINISKYEKENIPAIKDNEPFVNNINNYRAGIDFEIDFIKYPNEGAKFYTTSWSDVAKNIYSNLNYERELVDSKYYVDDLQLLTKGTKDDYQRVMNIFQFVKQKVKWNGYKGIYLDKTLKRAYKEGSGNVAVINLLLTSILRKVGLDVNPVLVSTQSNGIPFFPTRNGFNYLISAVTIENRIMLLDASEYYSYPNLLPKRALNWNGRLIMQDGNSSWINLTSGALSKKESTASVKINNEGFLEGITRDKFIGLEALEYRNNYNKIDQSQLISDLEVRYAIDIANYKINNKEKISKAITRIIKFSSEDLVERINQKMYIKPLLFYGYSSNPFKLKERKFPIEFSSPWEEKHTIVIEIPSNYNIESTPETKALSLPNNLGIFKYKVIISGKTIRVLSLLKFNSSTINEDYYQILKGFFAEFIKKQSEKIVLIKS